MGLPRLKEGGTIWLPYTEIVQASFRDYRKELLVFDIRFVEDLTENPLYAATAKTEVERDLCLCQPPLVNESQVKPLLERSKTPFVALTRKAIVVPAAKESTKRKRQSH